MTKKHLFWIAVLLFSAMELMADALSPEQAGQIASRFMTEYRHRRLEQGLPVRHAAPAAGLMETAVLFDAVDKAGQPYLYTVRFPEQGGYVLVSGDDRFAAVLGYSEDGGLDEQHMPEHIRAWLQGYIDEMQYLESVGYTPSVTTRAGASKAAIQPLIATRWNQGEPYYNACPYDKTNKHSVTGCVATAMAQFINYHMQHSHAPVAIQTQIDAYQTKSYGLAVDAIPAGTLLPDPSLLVNSYAGETTAAQKEAVAQLMLYCGASVQMDYASGSSSASFSRVPGALMNHFGFDASTRYVSRSDYSYAHWMNLIYDELAASRPVLYDGHSSRGGHAFIVDGYDGAGLFHLNWGWGGSSDDYFALSVLNPDDDDQIGASVSSDGYSGTQNAILACTIGGSLPAVTPCMTMQLTAVDGQKITYSTYNYTGETRSFNYGIGFVESDGSYTLIGSYQTATDLKDRYGWQTRTATVPINFSKAQTTQKIVLISREVGSDTWCTTADPDVYYVSAEYNMIGVPSLTIHPVSNLTGSGLSVPTSKYVDEQQTVQFSLTNTGEEFYGSTYLFASTTKTKGDYVLWRGLTALRNTTQLVRYDWTPKALGTYNLWIALDEEGTEVIDSTTVTITEDVGLKNKTLAIVSIKFEGMDNESWQIDPLTGVRMVDVYADSLKGSIRVKNLTESTVNSFKQRIEFDKYNAATGEYVKEKTNRYYSAYYTAGQTRGWAVTRTDLPTDNIYRIRVSRRDSEQSFGELLDDHYIIRLHTPKVTPTGIENTEKDPTDSKSESITRKIIKDGHLLILRDGKTYTVTGQELN